MRRNLRRARRSAPEPAAIRKKPARRRATLRLRRRCETRVPHDVRSCRVRDDFGARPAPLPVAKVAGVPRDAGTVARRTCFDDRLARPMQPVADVREPLRGHEVAVRTDDEFREVGVDLRPVLFLDECAADVSSRSRTQCPPVRIIGRALAVRRSSVPAERPQTLVAGRRRRPRGVLQPNAVDPVQTKRPYGHPAMVAVLRTSFTAGDTSGKLRTDSQSC